MKKLILIFAFAIIGSCTFTSCANDPFKDVKIVAPKDTSTTTTNPPDGGTIGSGGSVIPPGND